MGQEALIASHDLARRSWAVKAFSMELIPRGLRSVGYSEPAEALGDSV
jgi:hypothetical protein